MDFEFLHSLREIDGANLPVKSMARRYAAGHQVPAHNHNRAQLLYASEGVVIVSTREGRWMIPPEHALWIPPHVEHAVEMLVDVKMLSLYLAADIVPGLPDAFRVMNVTDLAHELIVAAVEPAPEDDVPGRLELVTPLLLHVIPTLPQVPLGLPFPADPRFAALCRRFMASPSPDVSIEHWAAELSMSRRSFTRAFRRQTGLSLSTWRQQASVFSALPRLAAGEPVTGVALDMGYDSIGAFITMFKRVLGASPRAYLTARGGNRSQRSQ
ncbi:helix-turn-helix transcriptional regulator [Ciceribacter sp. L1K22]|uniref:AraC family transcriptional regulator n=1 Tax=Ciceribacter sp. L1K22 TaxID=2820275 RepID=UPI001ABE54EC|nr:helix-turn-helix transcriptional regulator [Ciceribacter sp. L1K22]MBO3758997.1 helix-turn-helix transcriptional regulator [Ciceribacter sp. L1K22]